jgi:uncharacterized protein (DUF4415 family)
MINHRAKATVLMRAFRLRMDNDVIAWFKNQRRGYQTKINSLLRAYMAEHRRKVA